MHYHNLDDALQHKTKEELEIENAIHEHQKIKAEADFMRAKAYKATMEALRYRQENKKAFEKLDSLFASEKSALIVGLIGMLSALVGCVLSFILFAPWYYLFLWCLVGFIVNGCIIIGESGICHSRNGFWRLRDWLYLPYLSCSVC